MFCYHCGRSLSEHSFCTACGADVSLYKRIIYVSNMFYNEGLAKASVRDLTGAISSLRQSLKFNKNNIEARNLLGLVYYEMGEVVAALSEWVISKNLRAEKNIADDYIAMVQANASRLDSINQTIKKYNQALLYCKQDSKDLAVIQLKKVLSLNPKFIRAHQLLALLYMDSEQWEKAQKELKKCMKIDRNNTMTLRYMKEVDRMLMPDDNGKQILRRQKEEAVRYQSDNEIIIQPLNVKEPKSAGGSTLINIAIGLVIGLATMYFLVVPAAVSNETAKGEKKIKEIANQMDVKTSRIQELEAQITGLEMEIDRLNAELNGYVGTDGTLQIIDSLLTASSTYLETQDVELTAANLETIAQTANIEGTSEAFQKLYYTLLGIVGEELATRYYAEGYSAYDDGDYEVAIEKLSKAFYYDNTNVEALYFTAQAYRKSGDIANALATYDRVIELFPDTQRAEKAQNYKENLSTDATN